MVKVQFYSLIRLLLKTESLLVPWAPDDRVHHILHKAQKAVSTPFLHKLLDEQGALHPGTIILINRHNILHLDKLQSVVRDDDLVALFPPGAGG